MTERPARGLLVRLIDFLFGYHGRIGRGGYWLGVVAAAALAGCIAAIADWAVVGDIGRYVALVCIIGVFAWIHSAATVKRLHDRNRSGAWYLLYGVLPAALFVGAIYLYAANDLITASLLSLLFALIVGWIVVELGFMRGTEEPNRYGPAT